MNAGNNISKPCHAVWIRRRLGVSRTGVSAGGTAGQPRCRSINCCDDDGINRFHPSDDDGINPWIHPSLELGSSDLGPPCCSYSGRAPPHPNGHIAVPWIGGMQHTLHFALHPDLSLLALLLNRLSSSLLRDFTPLSHLHTSLVLITAPSDFLSSPWIRRICRLRWRWVLH